MTTEDADRRKSVGRTLATVTAVAGILAAVHGLFLKFHLADTPQAKYDSRQGTWLLAAAAAALVGSATAHLLLRRVGVRHAATSAALAGVVALAGISGVLVAEFQRTKPTAEVARRTEHISDFAPPAGARDERTSEKNGAGRVDRYWTYDKPVTELCDSAISRFREWAEQGSVTTDRYADSCGATGRYENGSAQLFVSQGPDGTNVHLRLSRED